MDPLVRPAPNAARTTILPFLILPSFAASSRAIITEAAKVFTYLFKFIKTLSFFIFKTLVRAEIIQILA